MHAGLLVHHRDLIDLVADGDLASDVHAAGHLTPVGVLAVEVIGVALDYEELAVIVYLGVASACHAESARLERKLIVLGGHLAATGAIARRIAALDHPVLYAVEGEA